MERTSAKKAKRLEKKKKKVEAFLRLAAENDADRTENRKVAKKRKSSTSDDSSDDNTCKRRAIESPEHTEKDTRPEELASSSCISTETSDSDQDEKSESCTDEERKALRAAVIARKKLSMERPKLFLRAEYQTLNISNATSSDSESPEKSKQPLFIIDIQHVLLYAIEGNLTSYKPRFCSLLRWGKLSQTLVIVMNGLTLDHFTDNKDCFPYLCESFDIKVPLVSPTQYNSSIPEELFKVPLSEEQIRKLREKTKDANKSVFKHLHQQITANKQVLVPVKLKVQDSLKAPAVAQPVDEEEEEEEEGSRPLTRLDLLLSPTQMMHEHYPLPAHRGEYDGYVFTKQKYDKVTAESPMFAIDCEMCQTVKYVHELAWIAVVNERNEVVYETYVKPRNRITNYLTRYSGVSRETLLNVKTRIEDVQKAIQDLLPGDAIICGQSLGSDLRAMQMFHPYVIDTSVIFNLSGMRHYKPSLRLLTEEFLGEQIQAGDHGHSPVEDSIATMKLVLHKLSHNVAYGDIILHNSSMVVDQKEIQTATTDEDNKKLKQVFFHRPGTSLCQSFFEITKRAQKSVLFVDREEMVERYKDGPDQTCVRTSDKESVKVVRDNIEPHALTWVQLHDGENMEKKDGEEQKNTLQKLDKMVKKLVSAVADKSLVVLLFPGQSDESELSDALACMQITNNKPS